MAPETQEVVLRGLDRALALHVGKLFDVLLSQPPEEGLERFWRGLNGAVGMHERLVEELEPGRMHRTGLFWLLVLAAAVLTMALIALGAL